MAGRTVVYASTPVYFYGLAHIKHVGKRSFSTLLPGCGFFNFTETSGYILLVEVQFHGLLQQRTFKTKVSALVSFVL